MRTVPTGFVAGTAFALALVLASSPVTTYAADADGAGEAEQSQTVDARGVAFEDQSTDTLDATPQSFETDGSISITYQVNKPPADDTPMVATQPIAQQPASARQGGLPTTGEHDPIMLPLLTMGAIGLCAATLINPERRKAP